MAGDICIMIAIIIALPRVIYNAVETITANASGTRERPVNISQSESARATVAPHPLASATRHQHAARYRYSLCIRGYARLAVLNVAFLSRSVDDSRDFARENYAEATNASFCVIFTWLG